MHVYFSVSTSTRNLKAYSFTDSKDMIADEILKNGSRDPDHAH